MKSLIQKLLEVRDKPILPMYEMIKRDLIASIVKNMDWMSAFHESSSPHSSPFVQTYPNSKTWFSLSCFSFGLTHSFQTCHNFYAHIWRRSLLSIHCHGIQWKPTTHESESTTIKSNSPPKIKTEINSVLFIIHSSSLSKSHTVSVSPKQTITKPIT